MRKLSYTGSPRISPQKSHPKLPRMAKGHAVLLLCLMCASLGQPVEPPSNDNIAQAEWVRSLIRSRSNSAIMAVFDEFPGGETATQYLDARRSYDFINFTATGTNEHATMELDEPSHGTHSSGIHQATPPLPHSPLGPVETIHYYRQTESSVWWKWKSPVNATIRLSTVGSTFDTTLGVYTRVPWNGYTVSNQFGVKKVAEGDDIWWNMRLQSEADFAAHAGEIYYIAVGGFRTATGLVKLQGTVESWIYPAAKIDRVASPVFELDLFGERQDSLQRRHTKFVKVTISCETPGAQIFYTTDGLMPNVLPTITQGLLAQETTKRFTEPLHMDSVTFRAVAYAPGMRRSLLSTSTSFQLQAVAPTFDPDGGVFEVVREVRILPTTDDEDAPRAVIHYTLDGSEPDLNSPLYVGRVELRNVSNITIRARVWNPSEWREDKRTTGSTSFEPGMFPSNVSVSNLFTVKERLPKVQVHMSGESDPMVLKGGNPPLAPKTYIGAATITFDIDDALAGIWFAFAKSLHTVESWTRYTGTFSVSEVGIHWMHVKGRRDGYTDSIPVTEGFEVVERIRVVEPNKAFLDTVQPQHYKYYTLNLTEVGTDVTVTVNKFYGSVDLFLSARQRRPSVHNHSLSAASFAEEGAQGGTRLLAMHIETHLGLEVVRIPFRNSTCPLCPYTYPTPIVVGIFGRGTSPTTMLVSINLETAPVARLSLLYHKAVEIGKWAYFRLYIGNGPEPTRRGLVVRVWQLPKSFVGLRIALRQSQPPTSDLAGTAYTMFGTADGYYQLTVPVNTPSREPWFLGIEGLVPVSGATTLNFTFAVGPMLEHDEPFPGRSFTQGYSMPAEGGALTATSNFVSQEIFEGVSVEASVRVGRFTFFRLRIRESLRWLEVRVTEKRFSGGLRILAQNGAPPSLVSHLAQNVTSSFDLGQGIEGYYYKAPVYEGKDFYIGVYGFSYDFQGQGNADEDMRVPEYRFSITATTAPRVSGLGLQDHQVITNNYRFFYKFSPAGSYRYFQVPHTDVTKDLHLVIRLASGTVDVVVSNTIKYPVRTDDGRKEVGWISSASAEGGRSVNIYTYDPGFKAGLYYIGVFAQFNADFGIAAYVESTSTLMELSKKYRVRSITYSSRYFRFKVEKLYAKLTVVFEEETSGEFMSAYFMQGSKPSGTSYMFFGNTPDAQGNIVFEHPDPQLDTYYLLIHFFKVGYTGPVRSHTYTVDIRVDYKDFDGYEAVRDLRPLENASFRNFRDQRYENLGLPRPPLWDQDRPSVQKIQTLEMARPQTAAFFGEPWVYYSVYVSTFSSTLTVTATPLSKGLSFTLVLRRSEKPTLTTFIDRAEKPDEHGDYVVRARSPVTGGLYYIGIYATVLVVKEARFVIMTSVDPGIPVIPNVQLLRNYFVLADTVPAMEYRYYKIYLPEDERDVSFELTRQFGETDMVVSNVNPWPRKGSYNASQPGWWQSLSATGGGTKITVRNYERGYLSPATYYVGVFAASFTSYFILARLDRPPPTVDVGTMFRSQVAEYAFSTFRFPVKGYILSRLVFVVKQQRPYNTGLALYAKRNEVPTLLDYDVRTDVSTFNGEYFLYMDFPAPEEVWYIGVFGLPAGQLPRGQNYYFLGTVLTRDGFKLYESSPYEQDPPNVPPPGNYVPPPSTSYTILPPETPIRSQLLNNGSFQFFRLQVSELTRVTVTAGETKMEGAKSSNWSFFLMARKFYLPTRQEPPYNNSHIESFVSEVCSQSADSLTLNKVGCHSSSSPSILISPSDNFANSSLWYVGVYAVGCRSLVTCAKWAVEPGVNLPAGIDCGCDETRVEAAPFNVTAVRVPRQGLYASLVQGPNNVTLRSPFNLHQFFTFEVNGSAAVRFSSRLRSGKGFFDVFVSDTIPYPQRAALPPESLRSEAALGNPPVSITVLKPEGEKSYVKVGVHAPGSVDLVIDCSYSPPYYPLVLGRSYAGLLRQDRFSSAGQERSLYNLDSKTHQGRRVILRIRPINTRCYDSRSSRVTTCESLSCCSGRNPFGGFIVSVAAENGVGSGWNHTQGEPNSQCIDSGLCRTSGNETEGTCCFEYREYKIVLDAQLAPTWLISITGKDESYMQGPRFTDSFEINVEIASAEDTISAPFRNSRGAILPSKTEEDQDKKDICYAGPRNDNAQGEFTAEGHYAFQSATRKGHFAGLVEEQPIISMRDGEPVTADSVEFGRWRIFRFMTDRAGTVTVTLRQHAGSFGLRLLVQREVLPTHESYLTFETTDPGDANLCTSTTGVGAMSCRRCTQKFCVCDGARGDNCTGKVHGSIPTEPLSENPIDGASAAIQAPIYPNEPFMIAVVVESQAFAPYSFTITAQQEVENYNKNPPCTNLSTGQVISGRILAHETIAFQAPPALPGFDARIRLETPFSDTWGKCRWGGNDGTTCTYDNSPEVYTGLSDRPYDTNCRGCFFDRGWRYVGTPLLVAYLRTKSYLYGVPGQQCFRNGMYTNRYNVTSKDTFPFYETYTRWNSDPFLAPYCNLNGKYPWYVPWILRDEWVDAIKVETDEECCDKCAREATCSFWTIAEDDNCTACEQQDVRYEDVYVRPASNVTFIPGTGESEWYESVPIIPIRGPHCYPAKRVRCCRLLSISETEMFRTKVPDVKTVSGSSGRCKPATNGHVVLTASQAVNCSSTSVQVEKNMIVDTAESIAKEAYLDDRQLFYMPGESDNTLVCVQWWNGKSTIITSEGIMSGPSVKPHCVRLSNHTIRLKVKDEDNLDQCLVNIGGGLPSTPKLYMCMDTVHRVGNGSEFDWKFYSVKHELVGGFGVEWACEDGRIVQRRSLGSSKFVPQGGGGCLWVKNDSPNGAQVVECADSETGPTIRAQQEWIITNSSIQGVPAGLIASAYGSKNCLTGVPGCPFSRRAWAGYCSASPSEVVMTACTRAGLASTSADILQGDGVYQAGQPVLIQLTGILSSSFSLAYNLIESPRIIMAEKEYWSKLVVGESSTSIKYRFMMNALDLPGRAGVQFYVVIHQLVPVVHPLHVTFRHRQISSLPAQRPVGWDDESNYVPEPFVQEQTLVCKDNRRSGPFCEVIFATDWLDFESPIMLTIDLQQTDFSDEDEFITSVTANTASMGSMFLESGGEDNRCFNMIRIVQSAVIPGSAFSGGQLRIGISTTPRVGDVLCGTNTLYAEVKLHQSKLGHDINGRHVVPLDSVSLAGPFDFDIMIEGNTTRAGDEVPINVRVWTSKPPFKSEPFPETFLRTGAPAPQAEVIKAEDVSKNIMCAVLNPIRNQVTKCGPPHELHTYDAHGAQQKSEGWWIYVRVSVPVEITAEIVDQSGNPVRSTSCSAYVFSQPASSSATLNVTEIRHRTGGVSNETINSTSHKLSAPLIFSPADETHVYVAFRFPGIAPSDGSANTSTAPFTCDRSLVYMNIRADSHIRNISLGSLHEVSSARPSERFLRVMVEEAAYHIISLTISAGNAAIFLQPEKADLPRRSHPPAADRSIESTAFGRSQQGWSAVSGFSQPFDLPLLTLSPDDDDFSLGSWIVAIFTDSSVVLSLKVNRIAVPPTLHLLQEYSLVRPAAASFDWRIPCHNLAGQAIRVSYVEVSGKSAQECPLSLFVQFSLPPTPNSWTEAACREGGNSSLVIPPQDEQGKKYLMFSAVRCPGGFGTNGTHCIRLGQCAKSDRVHQICKSTASLAPVIIPPLQDCSFRLQLSTLPQVVLV